jgi:hypothetical protein
MTGREQLVVWLRTFPGWLELQRAVAAAATVSVGEVLAFNEGGDAPIFLDADVKIRGFQTKATIYVDRSRALIPAPVALARTLAMYVDGDVAVDETPLGEERSWVLARADGTLQRAAALPAPGGALVLDEEALTLYAPRPRGNVSDPGV